MKKVNLTSESDNIGSGAPVLMNDLRQWGVLVLLSDKIARDIDEEKLYLPETSNLSVSGTG